LIKKILRNENLLFFESTDLLLFSLSKKKIASRVKNFNFFTQKAI